MAAVVLEHASSPLSFVLCAAFLAGFIDSIVGGGGLIQVPALFSAYPDIAPEVLLGTNKLGSIFGTGSAAVRYTRWVKIPWRLVAPAAAVAFATALLGASLVDRVSPALFRPLVPVMLTFVLVYVLLQKNLGASHAPQSLSRRDGGAALAGIGTIGLYDGFFGPGTGSFLMLLFIRVYGFDYLHASAGARMVNVATNAGALLWFGLHSQIHWVLGVALGVSNASGSLLGVRTARRRGTKFVRVVFIVVVSALILKTARDAMT